MSSPTLAKKENAGNNARPSHKRTCSAFEDNPAEGTCLVAQHTIEWPCKCDKKNPEFSCLRLFFCASERKQVQMYPATINVTMQVTAELRNRSDFVQKVPVLSL